MLASQMVTPTLTAVNTSIPTSTLLPTVAHTESLVPTTTTTTGTVTGLVKWGGKPYEGVTLLMCSDPIYGKCKGLYYETITDTQGSYTFTSVEPGSYIILPSVSGELDIHLSYWDSPQFQVFAGETLLREEMQYVKYNLNVYSPVKLADGSVTLHWMASPTESYWCEIYDVYFKEYGSCRENINSTPYSSTSFKLQSLPPGNYFYIVCTIFWGDGESCGVDRFTIP